MPDTLTADVLPFRAPPARHGLTTADRIEALQWEATKAVGESMRLAFHRWCGENAADGGEYISIYRGDDRWAAWGATRRGRFVNVWRCATGADLGEFATMQEALAALKASLLTRKR